MKNFMVVAVLTFIGVVGWRVGNAISPDAIGMAVGFLFGILAGIPGSLLIMAVNRKNDQNRIMEEDMRRGSQRPQGGGNQWGNGGGSPIILLTGNGQLQHPQPPPMPPQQEWPQWQSAPPSRQIASVADTAEDFEATSPKGRKFKVVGEEASAW